MAEAWGDYLDRHRDEIAENFERAAELIRAGDTHGLAEHVGRNRRARAEAAASDSHAASTHPDTLAAGHENWPNVTRWPLGSAWIGRVDGHSIGLPSEEAAMEVLAVIEKHDPEGVERGDYFVDVERGEGDHAA